MLSYSKFIGTVSEEEFLIIPGLIEPPVRTLGATVLEIGATASGNAEPL